MKKLNLLKNLFLLLFLLFTLNISYSQNLFNIINRSSENTPQTNLRNFLTSKSYVENVNIITLGSIANSQLNGIIKLKIPGHDSVYSYRVQHYSDINGIKTWSGELLTNESPLSNSNQNINTFLADSTDIGYLNLNEFDGKIFGSFNFNEENYLIRYFNFNQIALVKTKIQTGNLCTVSDYQSFDEENEEEVLIRNSNNCDIFILVAVSEAFALENPDFENLVINEVEKTNTSLNNSEATHSNSRIKISDIILLDSDDWSPIDDKDNEILPSNLYLQQQRDNYKSDFVVVISPDFHVDWQGAVPPASLSLNPVTVDANAYAIVDASGILGGNLTLTHELGHLMGCRHQSPGLNFCFDFSDDDGLEKAHGFKITKKRSPFFQDKHFTTIMTACVLPGNELMNFSNVSVKVKGKRTGTNVHDSHNCSANNAHVIKEHFCNRSLFEESIPAAYAKINGVTNGCPGELINLYSEYFDIAAPITFTWELSFDGFNFFNTQTGLSSQYAFNLPFTANTNLFVRLTVNGSNAVFQDWLTIHIGPSGPECVQHIGEETSSNEAHIDKSSVFLLHNDFNNLKLLRESNRAIKYHIINIFGQVLSYGNYDTFGPSEIFDSLIPGIYFRVLSDDKGIINTTKFIITHN